MSHNKALKLLCELTALSSFNFKLKVIQLKTSLAIGKLMGKKEYLKIYDILLK